MTRPRSRILAGRVSAILGSRITVDLWTDPDTGETCSLDAPLAPSIGVEGTAYASVSDDGAVIIGQPLGGPGSGVWLYRGTDASVDPGSGGLAINGSGGSPRTFAVSETDGDGFTRNLSVLAIGDNVTVTDDPATPPVTGFARYVIDSVPVDNGSWWTFTGRRTDVSGVTTAPPIGTRLRVLSSAGSSGAGGGPYTVRFDTYQQLLDGIVIGG